jgi:hypothetical protein
MLDQTARSQRERKKARLREPAGRPRSGRLPAFRRLQYARGSGNPSQFAVRGGRTPIAPVPKACAHSVPQEQRDIERAFALKDFVNIISYLPSTFTTLFGLACALLLGYIQ